jgi:hypothetical protein
MNSNLPTDTRNVLEVANNIVTALAEGLTKASLIYKEYVDQGGDVDELQRVSGLPSDLWQTLEDVATGRVDVRVFCLPAHTQRAIKKLPPTKQKSVLEHGVEVLANDNSAITVPIQELTSKQRSQVFYRGNIRSLSEQAAWLKTLAPPMENDKVCFVKGDCLVIQAPTTLTMSEIHQYLAQMR